MKRKKKETQKMRTQKMKTHKMKTQIWKSKKQYLKDKKNGVVISILLISPKSLYKRLHLSM